MGKKLKRFSPFKNDRFGLKYIWFRIRLNRHIKWSVKINAEIAERCVSLARRIDRPSSEEEKKVLAKAVDAFDDAIKELEEHMRYPRLYIKEVEE